MKFVTSFLSLLLLTVVTAQEPSGEPDTSGAIDSSEAIGVDPITAPLPRPTIYGLVANSNEHTILRAVFDALPTISDTLDEPGTRFTLFAPTDSAFRDLVNQITRGQQANTVDDVIQQLLENLPKLDAVPGFTDVRGIIFYHLIGRHYTFAELEDFGTVATAQGKNLSFVDGRVRDLDPSRNDADVVVKNIFTQNGWVHSITRILLPFDLRKAIRLARGSPRPRPTDNGNVTATDGPTTTDDPGDTPDPDATGEAEITGSPQGEEEEDDPICFPSTARVHTPEGTITMDQLEAGQEVAHEESGKFSKVFLFTHRTKAHEGWFYKITTSTGHAVTMTANHYLYANDRLTAAGAVVIGDLLRTVGGVSPVVKVERVRGTGLYAPHSVHGDLVVDGIVVSGYSRTVRPGVAHAVLAPVRWFVKVTGVREPFGSVLYDGGRGVEKYLPKGKPRY